MVLPMTLLLSSDNMSQTKNGNKTKSTRCGKWCQYPIDVIHFWQHGTSSAQQICWLTKQCYIFHCHGLASMSLQICPDTPTLSHYIHTWLTFLLSCLHVCEQNLTLASEYVYTRISTNIVYLVQQRMYNISKSQSNVMLKHDIINTQC